MTLATIAAELGVSRMTVSNAYNRPEKLSPALRERVLATAKRLGYAGPDPLAATLSRGRIGALGLIFDDPLPYAFTDPAAVLFFEGVAAVCERERVGLSLVPSRLGTPPETDLTRTALVDGFIVYSDVADDGRLDVIEARDLPLVIADGPPRGDAPCVGIDDRGRRAGGGRAPARARPPPDRDRRAAALTRRLRGPVRRAPPGDASATTARASASPASAPRSRPPASTGRSVAIEERAPHGRDAGRRAAAALLDRAERPTALLAMSDELAIGALHAAEERGLAVPGELSIIGFDDTPAASDARPPLTTIAQPHREKGETAARMLLRPQDAAGARGPADRPRRA